MKPWSVYILRDPRNNEVRYVGVTRVTLRKRLARHLKDRRDTPKCAWIRELQNHDRTPSIEVVETGCGDCWQEAERLWIKRYKADGFMLTNATDGGNGTVGYQFTPEVRAKIGAAARGKKHSPERIAKFAASHRALHRKLSDEHKAIVSRTHKGHCFWSEETKRRVAEKISMRPVTAQTRAKISALKKGKPKSAETKAKLSTANLGKKATPEARAKMSAVWKEKRLERVLQRIKPTEDLRCSCGNCDLCRARERRRRQSLGLDPLPPLSRKKPWGAKRRAAEAQKSMTEVMCVVCGKPFLATNAARAKYCRGYCATKAFRMRHREVK